MKNTVDDFIGTIESDEDIDQPEELEEPTQQNLSKKDQIQRRRNKEIINDKPSNSQARDLELDFDFENINTHLNLSNNNQQDQVNPIDSIINKKIDSLDENIHSKRQAVMDDGDGNSDRSDSDSDNDNDLDDDLDQDNHNDISDSHSDNDNDDDSDTHSVSSASSSSSSSAQKKDYFATPAATPKNSKNTFSSLALSRPILKAISSLGFTQPTPIQKSVLPVALAGKDIVGQAVTGSGKTAAFILPILERLMYRPKSSSKSGETRVLILCPTRELASQCFQVAQSLSKFMGDISFALVVGGLSLKLQEQELKQRPDVVIATPGRLIDHVRNSPSFNLDSLDILIMDEADRMLEDGFKDELDEIVKECPTNRQTMLFSATMTDKVDELVRLSLDKPARLFVDPKKSTAKGLTQEFVRVKSNTKNDLTERTATLLALCRRTFRHRTIIFFRSKALAHRMRILFGLMEMRADELHGDLSQEGRLSSLDRFKNDKSDFLLATDLASRGLDIKGVETVINFDLPNQIEIYLHRVGRTARANLTGRSISLIGESDRKMLKSVVKRSSAQSSDSIKHRIVPQDILRSVAELVAGLDGQIDDVLKLEKEERAMRVAEMELVKSKNMIEHQDEIMARPARTWFQTEKEKRESKDTGKEEYNKKFDQPDQITQKTAKTHDSLGRKLTSSSGLSRRDRRKKEMKEEYEADKNKGWNVDHAVRSAKKSAKPQKMSVLADTSKPKESAAPSKKRKSSAGPSFTEDKSVKPPKKNEGERAKPGAAVGRSNKKARTKGPKKGSK
ncbi:hypothetical protein E3P86_03766 [Wallemia ichthyophaga]|uniref:RNA helicase n=1 Tax=Wallemia ichthyophaga TaxID=245174 RepID=A0A4T0IGV7_WALIC|nr:hypothetical protein E3P86_03766 [Wallemia ichthyophaga]